MTRKSVMDHMKKARLYRAKFKVKPECCAMFYCIACQNINRFAGKKYNPNHCEKHCRHKKERSLIPKIIGKDERR